VNTAGCGWATIRISVSTLLDELVGLGFGGLYTSLTGAIGGDGPRPRCEPCQSKRAATFVVITHPPADETQWDWVELPDCRRLG
jgi:hypothetical protein